MKLVFILVVLVCFLAYNPTEAVVPELPGDLAHLETYLKNQEALVQGLQNDIASLTNAVHQISASLAKLAAQIAALHGK
ncbi:hypothetical protein ACROYT_G031088 [Oculina patagonica]